MTCTVVTREEIPAEVLAAHEYAWGNAGGDSEAALMEGSRIVSWHKTRKAAQSALSRRNATFAVR